MKKLIISVWAFIALPLFAQRDANIRIYPEQGNQQISKHIIRAIRRTSRELIDRGLWVGPESIFPDPRIPYGVSNALKKLTDPELTLAGRLLRRRISLDGWNRPRKSPKMVNNNWGGTIEDKSSEPMSS